MPGHQLHPRPFVPNSKRPRVVVWPAPGPSVPVRALRVGWDRRQVGYQLRAGYTLFFHYAPLTLRRRCWVPPKAHMSTSGSGRRGAGQRTAHRWRRKRASKCGWPAPQPTLTLLEFLLRRATRIPNAPDAHSTGILARSVRDFARASELVVSAIDTIMGLCGTAGFATSHPIQRAWRDIHLASMHISLNTETNYAHFGRMELGLERDPSQPYF